MCTRRKDFASRKERELLFWAEATHTVQGCASVREFGVQLEDSSATSFVSLDPPDASLDVEFGHLEGLKTRHLGQAFLRMQIGSPFTRFQVNGAPFKWSAAGGHWEALDVSMRRMFPLFLSPPTTSLNQVVFLLAKSQETLACNGGCVSIIRACADKSARQRPIPVRFAPKTSCTVKYCMSTHKARSVLYVCL
jgi:hypothetical protein